jgi:membrane protein involved in colicin uptake
MVSLIGLAIGRTLAERAKVSDDEVARFGLLGAAAPSPLLGAVLVDSALRRGREGVNVAGRGSLLGAVRSDPDELRKRRDQQREREEQREREFELAQQREEEQRERARTRAETRKALQDVARWVAAMDEDITTQRSGTVDVEGVWQGFQKAIARLTARVAEAKQEADEKAAGEADQKGPDGD